MLLQQGSQIITISLVSALYFLGFGKHYGGEMNLYIYFFSIARASHFDQKSKENRRTNNDMDKSRTIFMGHLSLSQKQDSKATKESQALGAVSSNI